MRKPPSIPIGGRSRLEANRESCQFKLGFCMFTSHSLITVFAKQGRALLISFNTLMKLMCYILYHLIYCVCQVEVLPGTHKMKQPLESFTRRIKETDPNAPLLYYILQGLLDASYYQLEIRALNDIGWSFPNSEYVFSTVPGTEERNLIML